MKIKLLFLISGLSASSLAKGQNTNSAQTPESISTIKIPKALFGKWLPSNNLTGLIAVDSVIHPDLCYSWDDTLEIRNGACVLNQKDTVDCLIKGLPNSVDVANYNLIISDTMYKLTWSMTRFTISFISEDYTWSQVLRKI